MPAPQPRRHWPSFANKASYWSRPMGGAPRLTEALAGEPVKGSWWAHPQGRRIFAILEGKIPWPRPSFPRLRAVQHEPAVHIRLLHCRHPAGKPGAANHERPGAGPVSGIIAIKSSPRHHRTHAAAAKRDADIDHPTGTNVFLQDEQCLIRTVKRQRRSERASQPHTPINFGRW